MNGGHPRRIVVVKVGGEVLLDETERCGLAQNVRALVDEGLSVVVLHGGGPQVSRLQEQLGFVPTKVGGRRVTSSRDLVMVEQAICGEVNVALTATLLEVGIDAFGCHGASGRLIRAEKRPPKRIPGAGDEPVDLGEVGDVIGVDTGLLDCLLARGLVPVIATLGVTATGGRIFNINADTTATRVAQALGAETLLLVTKVGGVFRDLDDPTSRFAQLTAAQAQQLIAEGVIAGGMIPKVEEALEVLQAGVRAIAIVGATQPDAFLAIVRRSKERGTRITPS
jgi:acetylglutamate kinase